MLSKVRVSIHTPYICIYILYIYIYVFDQIELCRKRNFLVALLVDHTQPAKLLDCELKDIT